MLVDLLVARGALDSWRITVIGDEPRRAYHRVHLSALFDGAAADDLSLADVDFFERPGLSLRPI